MPADSADRKPALPLRVFLASPGDVADERSLALRVLDRLAYDPFLRERVGIRTVAWDKPGADTPMLATLTPQEAVSLQRPKPSECDVVVVIFWSQMGTPLPSEYTKKDGSPFLSGTEWEYLDAVRASESAGKPQILLYRRTEVPAVALDDPDKPEKERQWKLVTDFFKAFMNPDGSIRGGVNEYESPDDFEKRLTEHLKEIFQQLLAEQEAKNEASAPAAGSETAETGGAAEITEAPKLWEGSPFPGLKAFDEGDAPIYFGRGRESDGLVRRLAEGSRFVAVVGASGAGKSSLVAAGLVPRLRGNAIPGSRDWTVLRFAPGAVGDNPFTALLSGLETVLQAHGRNPEDEAVRLEGSPVPLDGLVEFLLADHKEWSEALLFVDQFEEFFTVVAKRYRKPFAALLAHAVASRRVRIVLTMRADFYHRCVEYPALAELLRTGSFPLAAPDRVALEEMITRPADRAGLHFDDGLPDRILDDTGEGPGALPLLAFALSELHEAGKGSRRLSEAAYEAFGHVQGAVSQRAESAFHELDAEARAALSDVFRELVEVKDVEGGWVATRRRAPLEDAAPTAAARRLVDAFVDGRLLVRDSDEDSQALLEVAHEALLRDWDRMVRWIEETGEDLWQLRELRRSADDWERNRKDSAYLWPRPRWRQAEAAIGRLKPKLEGAAKPFLTASRRTTWRKGVTRGLGAFAVAVLLAVLGWLQIEGVPVPETYAMLKGRLGLDYREPVLVPIKSGTFMMGEVGAQREVTIERPFRMGQHEVTFDEYDLFARLTGRTLPDQEGWGRGRLPVINVSWNDVIAYVEWLSEKTGKAYGLPSEAEWEFAARAGTETAYFWGNEVGENNANCSGCGSEWDGRKTAPVGSFKANDWGLHDMHGNVEEWVEDCYGGYSDAPVDGSPALKAEGCPRVLRGGSWGSDPVFLRASGRVRGLPDFRGDVIGFRVVCRPQSSTEC